MKTYVMVDIESNGPIPGDYSMTQLGAVIVDEHLNKTFQINIKPISDKTIPKRIDKSHKENAIEAKKAMLQFKNWIKENCKSKPKFISDNNGYDWMFVCWYFEHFVDENPFGYNSDNLNTFYKGKTNNLNNNIEPLRIRELMHSALEDAKDNAKIFLELKKIK